MTLKECTQVLRDLALAMRADVDEASYRIYHRALKDVPLALLTTTVNGLMDAGIEFFPGAPKLKAECEKARRQWIAAHPHEPCAECEGQRGFRNIITANGQRTVERCPCVTRYQERLASMGMQAPIALLPGEEAAAAEPMHPTAELLPAEVRGRVREIVAQKGMR